MQNLHIAFPVSGTRFTGSTARSTGTQFSIWATQTLRDHLLCGYTLNEKRLRERGLDEAKQAVDLLSNTLKNQSLVTEQGRAVLDVVQHYTHAWRLLLEFDEDRLATSPTNRSRLRAN